MSECCRTLVNFINILRAAFAPIFFCQKNFEAKLQVEKSCGKHFCTKNLRAQNVDEIETLSICETEFKAFSGLLSDRMMHRLQRHSSSSFRKKNILKMIVWFDF